MLIAWRPFVVGMLCALPLVVLNVLVATPVPAFVAWLRPDGQTSVLEWVFVWSAIVAVMGGGVVVLSVLWRQRRLVVCNALFGVILLGAGVMLTVTLGSEMLACEWQHLPNCD